MADARTHKLTPGKPVELAAFPTTSDPYWSDSRDAAESAFRALRKRFIELQRRFYAAHEQKLLVVLQAMDAGGKDGAIRNITRGANPQGVRVESFKAPSSADLARDYLWRVHKAVPPTGHITIFNRSHYGDVLVVRVENLVPEDQWQQRYDQINDFERMLSETGTHILKFYLHISNDEQRRRLQSRADEPDKNWKLVPADLEKRAQWDDYQVAYQDALARCTTDWAPWYVIPADQKWYRNLAIMQVIVDRLETIDPQYPPSKFDVSGLIIP